MKVCNKKLTEIRPYARNPRHNDVAVDAVARSIEEFGFRQPIVVDTRGVIVVGDTRDKAAQKLGLKTVPVHVAVGLTSEQVRAYRIADNKLGDLADWDAELLSSELKALESLELDLSLLGFDKDELAQLFGETIAGGLTDPDLIPDPPDEPVTQTGDLWLLGDHRLLCGDASKQQDFDRLLDGAAIHLVNTDPPYNVKVEPRSNNAIAAGLSSFTNDPAAKKLSSRRGNAAFDIAHGAARIAGAHHQGFDLSRHPKKFKPTSTKLRAKDRPLANDFVADEAFHQLLHAWFGNIARVLAPGPQLLYLGRVRQLCELSSRAQGGRPVLLTGDHLGQGASRVDAQGFYGQPRVVLLWLAGRRRTQVPRAQ